jgi:hypothetical protein
MLNAVVILVTRSRDISVIIVSVSRMDDRAIGIPFAAEAAKGLFI